MIITFKADIEYRRGYLSYDTVKEKDATVVIDSNEESEGSDYVKLTILRITNADGQRIA